ncbi:MAG: LPS export ABC transporter ATP-binding protein [Syntrophales bacterium]|nr:LPS export ABC transporter ATP-binding protein [Syntrophales bacterium]
MLNASPEGEIVRTSAGFWRRLAAGMLDFMLCLGLYALLYLGTAEYLKYLKNDLLFDLYWQVIPGFFFFLFIYGLFLEILPMRTTAGKSIFSIRVYDREGNPAGLVRVILRNFAKLLTLLTAGIGFLLCAFRKDRLTLHDLLSGCTVMRVEKTPTRTLNKTVQPGSLKGKLVATGLVKIYGGMRVVNGVNLEIYPGEVVGLLGPNGAGKTTTFYMIVGLIKPDDGQILIDGEDVSRCPMYIRARKGLNYLPQEPSIFRKLTVEENILAILETLDLNRQERRERLKELLRELDLTPLAKNRAYSLSGGERRRVEITRALVTSPKYILLDEPFAGIDPLAVADIQNIIGTLKAKGIGVIISDHNVRETLSVCDRAYIVNEGSILVEGDPDTISRSEIARKIYFGENFSLKPAVRKDAEDEKMVLSYDGESFRLKDNAQDE